MNIETVDLSHDYQKSGEGANGESYNATSDPSVMLKIYNHSFPRQMIIEELEVAQKVYNLGIPSPEPGCLVTDGDRLGIKYRRIVGKRSYSRMIADEPHRLEEFSREFARYCKQLHATPCPDGLFVETKTQFQTLLEGDKVFGEREKSVMADFLSRIPDHRTAVHGDMHIGNLISTLPIGAPLSTPHLVNFIDIGLFSRGCPLLDIGMMLIVCFLSDEEFRTQTFHLTGAQTREVWDVFVDEYFFGQDQLATRYFGENATPQDVYSGILPYACLKLFLIEHHMGMLFPHFEKVIRDTFGF